jgi:hypothetical protein
MRPALIKKHQRLDVLLTASPLKHDIECDNSLSGLRQLLCLPRLPFYLPELLHIQSYDDSMKIALI